MDSNIRGSWEKFKVVHEEDLLVKANYKEKFESQESKILITIAPSVINDRPTSGVLLQKGASVDEIPLESTVYFEKTTGYDLYFEENKNEWYILMHKDSVLGYSI